MSDRCRVCVREVDPDATHPDKTLCGVCYDVVVSSAAENVREENST